MPLTVQLFTVTSALAPHPSIDFTVPSEYKILGGGALDNWSGAGNLLTASYPKGLQTWSVAGKDHEAPSPASLTLFALALYDPNNEWDVTIEQETSDPASHPQAAATLLPGYTLTGGGAFVDYHGAGNLLTASFPTSVAAWEARSKDHDLADPARITAYAIGIRHRSGNVTVSHVIRETTGAVAAHPSARVCLDMDPGSILTGGGALDNWDGDGNLLTGSFPQGNCWIGAGKDHIHSAPASITVYAIGIKA
jgi:hypothetical protein